MTPAADNPPRKPRSRTLIRKDDVRKIVRGAIEGGMPIGRIRYCNGELELFALDDSAPASEADDLERRMREAFGEGDDD